MTAMRVNLFDLCKPKQWPVLSAAKMSEAGFPVFGANGRIGFSDTYTHEHPVLLVGCRGSCGTLHVTPPRSYANGNAMALDSLDTSRVALEYLVHFLRWRGFHDVISGSSQPQITQTTLRRIDVPLPPLAEQKRIAAVLDKADDLRGKRRQAIARLDTLLQSVFLDMFGDAADMERVPLREVCDTIDSGSTPKSALLLESREPNAVCFIKVNHIVDGGRVSHSVRPFFIPREVHNGPLRRSQCVPGDVLINIVGPPLGKIGIVPPELGECNINQAIVRVRPGKELVPLFLLHALLAPKMLREIIALGRGIRQLNISVNEIRDLAVPVAPVALQRKFAEGARQTQRVRDHLTRGRTENEALFSSLQTGAFAGTLFSGSPANLKKLVAAAL